MNNLQLIKSEQFGNIQCDFYHKDDAICMTSEQLGQALGYADPQKAISNLVSRNTYLEQSEFSSFLNLRSEAGIRETRVFTEDGIYEVTMLSRTEQAAAFRAWVRMVIKSIRRHGMYLTPDVAKMALEDKTMFLAKAVLAANDVISDLTSKLEAAKPAVAFVEKYVEATALKNFREVAKILGFKERDFINQLLEWGIVFRQGGTLLPYAPYQHKGYFEVKTGEKGGYAYHQTRFTTSGIAWIAERFAKKPA